MVLAAREVPPLLALVAWAALAVLRALVALEAMADLVQTRSVVKQVVQRWPVALAGMVAAAGWVARAARAGAFLALAPTAVVASAVLAARPVLLVTAVAVERVIP